MVLPSAFLTYLKHTFLESLVIKTNSQVDSKLGIEVTKKGELYEVNKITFTGYAIRYAPSCTNNGRGSISTPNCTAARIG